MNQQIAGVLRFLKKAILFTKDKVARFNFLYRQKRLDAKLISQLNSKKIPSWKQLTHAHNLVSKTEKNLLKLAYILFGVGLIWLGFNFFFKGTETKPDFGGSYTEGLVGRPLYINPLLSQTNDVDSDLVKIIFNGLVRYDSNNQIIGDLAESWTTNETQTSYSFKIKKGVTWHDGEDLTVNDVFFTFQLLKDPEFKSPLKATFEGINADITGEDEITFSLQEPYSGFLNIMTFGILPQHLWFEVPTASAHLAKYNQKPIGTGPYSFKSFTKDKNGQIVAYNFESNSKYHLSQPYIKNISFKFYSDILSAITALKNKQVQGLGFIPKEYLNELPKRGLDTTNIPRSQFTAIFFNADKDSLSNNKIVKQALTLATDKQRLVNEVISGNGQSLSTPILPGSIGFNSEINDEFNPVTAAETLVADGWAMSEIRLNIDGTVAPEPKEGEEATGQLEKVLVKKGTPLVITLTTSDQPEYISLVEKIKEDWEKIGVKVILKTVEIKTFIKETIPNRDYNLLVYGGIIGYNDDPFSYWHSSQRQAPGVNLSQYVNRKIDEVLEKARKTSDKEERAKNYSEFQDMLKKDIPAIFLYSPNYTYSHSDTLKNINITKINLPSDRFWNIHQWYIKTKKSK